MSDRWTEDDILDKVRTLYERPPSKCPHGYCRRGYVCDSCVKDLLRAALGREET